MRLTNLGGQIEHSQGRPEDKETTMGGGGGLKVAGAWGKDLSLAISVKSQGGHD